MQNDLISMLGGRRGHFQLESGHHGELWLELDPLFNPADRVRPFALELARRLAVHRVDAICGPATGGAKLAELIAQHLEIEYLFAEREVSQRTGLFPVDYRLPPTMRMQARGKSVAIVDDAIATGSAVRGTYEDLLACGARPLVLGALIVFGDAAADFAAAHSLGLEALTRTTARTWTSGECPLCQAGVLLQLPSNAA